MSVAIGIDLGTTNTVVAAVVDGVAVTLEDEKNRRLLPSVVSFHPSGTVLVGDSARDRRLIDPENTIFSVKPLIGRAFTTDEVVQARSRFPFRLVEGAKNSTMVVARDVPYALPEISAFVLRRAKAIAEAALGEPVERAVITVPANFNDLQRASTKIAGKLAGLDVMRILNEPTAAALAYGQSIAKAEKIAVYDLGGGTFDITLLDLTGNVFEVLATAGDTALGGDDIDRLIADRIALEVVRQFNFDPRSDPVAYGRLRFVAEEMKQELSSRMVAERDISGIGYTEDGQPITMRMVLSRDDLEKTAFPLVERTMSVAKGSIEIIGLHPKDFDRVILVGGSTRMPLVARLVEHLFEQPPHLKVNPDEVVALGAAIQAHALNRSRAAKAKRPSASEQLAQANPSAPAMPPGTPQFFEFSKAPAVITFSPPPADTYETTPIPKNPLPSLQATQPMFGRSEHAAPPPPGGRSIEGTPARKPPPPVPVGPKPPRISAAPARTDEVHAAVTRPPPPGTGSYAGPAARGLDDLDDPFELADHTSPMLGAPPRPEPPDHTSPMMDAPRRPDAASLGMDAPFLPELPLPSSKIEAAPELELELVPDLLVDEAPSSHDLGAMIAAGDFFPDENEGPTRGPSLIEGLVAKGSAIATAESAPLLIDVTPLTLRVETVGGYSDVLIDANTAVPCERTRAFLTASDNQTSVFIRVAQGEGARYAENTHLGELELSGLQPGPRGTVKILVTFELDADGILNVRAKDKDSGRETTTRLRLLGASTDAADVAAMQARQDRVAVA